MPVCCELHKLLFRSVQKKTGCCQFFYLIPENSHEGNLQNYIHISQPQYWVHSLTFLLTAFVWFHALSGVQRKTVMNCWQKTYKGCKFPVFRLLCELSKIEYLEYKIWGNCLSKSHYRNLEITVRNSSCLNDGGCTLDIFSLG